MPQFVCDNDPKKWGKVLSGGIVCISPEELRKMDDIFVVILPENSVIAYAIARQLSDYGITEFDAYDNWIRYASDFFSEESFRR